MHNHQAEISSIKRIKYILQNQSSQQIDTKVLFNLSQSMQLSELYALNLPALLQLISHRHRNSELLLVALNLETLPLNQFNSMSFNFMLFGNDLETEFMLRLLVLSSRSLAPISGRMQFDISSYYNYGIGSITAIRQNYPWLAVCDHCKSAHRIYFCYVYRYLFENYHQKLMIPSIYRIYADDASKERQNLMYLIEHHSFIPWHTETLAQMKQKQREMKGCDDLVRLDEFYGKLMRSVSRYALKSQWLLYDIMTHIVLNEFGNCTIGLSDPSVAQGEMILKKLIAHNSRLCKFDLKHKLIDLSAKLFNQSVLRYS